MTKVLILSDSHGLTTEITKIKERHHASYYIHCGDSELPKDAHELQDFITVKGNCDWQGDFPLEKIITIGGLRFLITHGHLFDVKAGLLQLQYRALEVDADVVCFGHSHIAYAEKVNGKLLINPGSIRQPKRFPDPGYVLLEWDDSMKIVVSFYSIYGEKLLNLPYRKQFNLKT